MLILEVVDVLARKLNMRGAAVVRGFLAADELQDFIGWVDEQVLEVGNDPEKIWDVCGYCLLQGVTEMYGIFPMLRSVQDTYQAEVTADRL